MFFFSNFVSEKAPMSIFSIFGGIIDRANFHNSERIKLTPQQKIASHDCIMKEQRSKLIHNRQTNGNADAEAKR